jgi:hypothetical protein
MAYSDLSFYWDDDLLSAIVQESPTGKLYKYIYEGNFEKVLQAIENNAQLNVGAFNALSLALDKYNQTKFGTQLKLASDKLSNENILTILSVKHFLLHVYIF